MRGDSLKERILRVATIEEVVAAYVPLQRSGAGYVGLCPFHADKHPSLHVHPGKQFFKCFACGEGGDLFAFVQKIEGCSFTEAMGKLAKRYSIDSREWTVDNYAGKKKRTDGKGTTGKRTAGSPDKTANENSDDQLSVVNSQLSIRTIGAANRLFASLLQPYVPEDEALRETYRLFGVGIAPPEVPADYRKMRSRLIFPIRDEKGGLVAFAARRRTDGEEGAKYVNSPASPVYSKSRVLYALDLAGEAIRERRFVFVTEGYKDALAMHAAGFTNTVALCGVAFTAGHLRLLAGYTQRIVLLLDADRAGEASMEKIVAMLSRGTGPEGERLEPACLFEVSRMQLPYGEDPDSLLNTVKSLLAFRHAHKDLNSDAPFKVLYAPKAKKDYRPFVWQRGDLICAVNPAGVAAELPLELAEDLHIQYTIGKAEIVNDTLSLGAQSFAILG